MTESKDVRVALSFDYDAISLWIGTFGAKSSLTSRGEFGVIGVRRILSTLAHNKISATFFVPGHTAYAFPKSVQDIAAAGHEIGHHGWIHEVPAMVSKERERWILEKGFKALQEVAGVRPVGYRSPASDNTPNSVPLLLDLGFEYDSSEMANDFEPYWCRVGDSYDLDTPYKFGTPVNLVEMPVSWHLDDFPHLEFVMSKVGLFPAAQTPDSLLKIWKDEFDFLYNRVGRGLFTITMHPQVVGRGHRMQLLEGIIEHVRDKPGVRFTTMVDYCRMWKKGKIPSLSPELGQG
ncbi:MAG TPA: polysaccharide deacetylase [Chthoniobacterales bacterium]